MSVRHLVGGHPGGTGSEETHRPAAIRSPAAETLVARIGHLAGSRRFRLQAAGLTALALVFLLALLLPNRTVRVMVDGDVTTVSSRIGSDATLVEQAGVELEQGDRIEARGDDELVVRRATEATLEVDGKNYTMRTQADTIDELLDQASIPLEPGDSVLRNQEFVSPSASVAPPPPLASALGGTAPAAAAAEQPVTLEVRRAVPFSVVENGHKLELSSSRETVATALRDVGVRLGPGDEVQPPVATDLTAGLEVHVDHAAEVTVTMPEGKTTVYTVAETADDALRESGIALPETYRLEPSADTPVSAGLVIHVVGISRELALETERIESRTIYEPDPALPWGEQRVVSGQDGVYYRQYDVVYENGVVVSRELTAEWYDPEPADTVVSYSTAPAPVAPQASAAAADWGELVCSYDWDCSWALAVIACESGGNPDAYNPAGYVGLFQIWEGHGPGLRDPATNVAAAYSLYVSGGRGNWPNCP